MTSRAASDASPCPCGRAGGLAECCGPYLAGELPAPDPESLMRSRYTAFALGTAEAIEYLLATHHPGHREANLREGLRASVAQVTAWERLEVLSAGVEGERGTVEFVATYRVGSQRMQLRERSEFVRADDRWFYTRGEVG